MKSFQNLFCETSCRAKKSVWELNFDPNDTVVVVSLRQISQFLCKLT